MYKILLLPFPSQELSQIWKYPTNLKWPWPLRFSFVSAKASQSDGVLSYTRRIEPIGAEELTDSWVHPVLRSCDNPQGESPPLKRTTGLYQDMAFETAHDLTFTFNPGSTFSAECFIYGRVETGKINWFKAGKPSTPVKEEEDWSRLDSDKEEEEADCGEEELAGQLDQ